MSERETARRLRAHGLKFKEIAEHLGRPVSTVEQWVNDPDGVKRRGRKKKYAGTCTDCGALTDGSHGYNYQPKRCQRCINMNAQQERDQIVGLWNKGVIEKDIAKELGVSCNQIRGRIGLARKKGETVELHRARNRTLWPQVERLYHAGATYEQIADECGTTLGNIGVMIGVMRRAGVDLPHRPGGGQKLDLPQDEIVQLYRSGLGMEAIGERFDVSTTPIKRVLTEAGVPTRPQGGRRKVVGVPSTVRVSSN